MVCLYNVTEEEGSVCICTLTDGWGRSVYAHEQTVGVGLYTHMDGWSRSVYAHEQTVGVGLYTHMNRRMGSVCICTWTDGWRGVFRMTSWLPYTHNVRYLVQIHTHADLVEFRQYIFYAVQFVTKCMNTAHCFIQCLLFFNYTNYTCTLSCSRTVVRYIPPILMEIDHHNRIEFLARVHPWWLFLQNNPVVRLKYSPPCQTPSKTMTHYISKRWHFLYFLICTNYVRIPATSQPCHMAGKCLPS